MSQALVKNTPREQKGRDTISRYKLQQKSTAIASLQLLRDNAIDYIYCDLHDDFVIRKQDKGIHSYTFFQVKTKEKLNDQWGTNDLYSIREKKSAKHPPSPELFKNSFIGKLLIHTFTFGNQCEAVIFQTNIHNKDIAEKLFTAIQHSDTSNSHLKEIINIFNSAYIEHTQKSLSETEIILKLQKLQFENDVEYLKPNNEMFQAYCGNEIYNYSEIEYSKSELEEIITKLLNLVECKSSGIIYDWNLDNINDKAGISLKELLSILGITHSAYLEVKKHSNHLAIKNTSILQRILKNMGITEEEHVNTLIRCKTLWDQWKMTNRAIISELKLVQLDLYIQETLKNLTGQGIKEIIDSTEIVTLKYKNFNLTSEHILGAFLTEMVKNEI